MGIYIKIHTSILLAFMLITGYAKAQVVDTVNLYDMSLDQLMNIQISSATKTSEAVTDIPSSIVIITRQTIQEQGWQTLEEILCNVPGMYLINDYLWFGTDNFGARGFFSTQSFNTMVIMVNGVTQKEDWYNSFPLSKVNVPVEAIDRIEVIRGPMSIIYGNSAFMGAINIVTNKNLTNNDVKVALGSNGNYRTFVRMVGNVSNKISYTINAGIYGSDGINRAYSDMTDHIDSTWNLPQNARSKGQLTDNRKYIDFSLQSKSFHFSMSQSNTRKGVIDFYPGFDDGHLAEIQASNVQVGYNKVFANDVNVKFDIGYYSFRNRLGYKHNSDTTSYGFNDIYSDAADAELSLNYKPTKKFDISIATYYQTVFRDKLVVDAPNLKNDYINLDAGLSRNERKETWALYSQTSYSISPKFTILGGLRIEQTPSYSIYYATKFDTLGNVNYISRKGTYKYGDPFLIPRLAFLYHINDNHHIKLMYSQAVKQASMGENMDIVRHPENKQLKPAKMETFEANYIGLIRNSTIINLSVFYNNVNNLISRTNQLVDGKMNLYNTNSGKLRTIGTELTTDFKLSQKINISFSAVYQYSKNLQKGYEHIKLEYAPNLLAYTTISLKFYKNATIGLSGYYIGPMETYWKPDKRDSNNPSDTRTPIELIRDGKRIGNRAPGYILTNLNIRFNDLFKKSLYCSIHIHNLLNSDVKFPTTRSNDEFEKGTFGYGRYITIGIGYIFNNED